MLFRFLFVDVLGWSVVGAGRRFLLRCGLGDSLLLSLEGGVECDILENSSGLRLCCGLDA